MKINKSKKAFTLIEALMAVAVFMIIATILINIYVATVRAERIAYTILRDSDVVQNVLEVMSRAIRMGSDFELTDNTSLQFKTEEEGKKFFTVFRYVYDDISEKGWIERVKDIDKNEEPTILIPDNMSIEDFEFEIYGDLNEQKNVLIKFNAVSKIYGNEYRTFIQTSITPRLLINN